MKPAHHTQRRQQQIILFGALLAMFVGAAQAAFKCQGADGKIEYSDRACEISKNTLDKPKTGSGVQTRPIDNPMAQLEKLFSDYEARLCEREKLDVELAAARHAGDIARQPAVWKARQDRQIELNEVLVDFQMRAGKITRAAGSDSKETAAMRKYQLGLKNCKPDQATPAPPPPPAAKAAKY